MELRYGYPFAGDSGEELDDHYLPLAGLRRPHIRVTNARLCAAPGFTNPTKEEAAACSSRHLARELRLTNPSVVLTLGAVATSLFGIDLDHSHGVPTRGRYEHWEGWVFPSYHPAQGIRVPTLINRIRTDFLDLGRRLPALLEGAYTGLADPYPYPIYRLIETERDLLVSLHHYQGDPDWLAVDTESDTVNGMAGAPPWCLTFSPRPGDGYLIRATDTGLLSWFNSWLHRHRPLVILHHAIHDVPVSADMGVEFPRWTDSMQMAYILQDTAMGLKPLAYRLCGMAMRDFEEVVHPYARRLAAAYMTDIRDEIEQEWKRPHVFKSGARKGQSELRFLLTVPELLRGTYNRAVALLRSLHGEPATGGEDPEEDADPWKRWDKWKPEVRETMTALAGYSLPRPSITQVPFAEALAYATRDADSTGRIYPLLWKRFRGREVRKGIAR
jgi:uracil-DNA glycosylase family 4